MKIYFKNNKDCFLIDDCFSHLLNEYYFSIHKTKTNSYFASIHKKTRKKTLLHRLLLKPANRKLDIDHINHNGLDNRLENIRIVNRTINNHNRRNVSGCYFEERTNKWRAEIHYENKRFKLGRFKTKEEAILAYRAKKKELLGDQFINSK